MTDKKREEYIKEKTTTLMFYFINTYLSAKQKDKEKMAKDFIHQIIKDWQPRVGKEWIRTLIDVCEDVREGEMSIENLYEMLEEAGFEVKK